MDLKAYLHAERGRLVALSRAIDAHPSDVSRWARGERPIPIPFGYPIERETGGQVTRREMFPLCTIERVWPELTETRRREAVEMRMRRKFRHHTADLLGRVGHASHELAFSTQSELQHENLNSNDRSNSRRLLL